MITIWEVLFSLDTLFPPISLYPGTAQAFPRSEHMKRKVLMFLDAKNTILLYLDWRRFFEVS